MNYATNATNPTLQPVNYAPAAPAPVNPNQGIGPYTMQSFGQGFSQLGSALSNDAAGILDSIAGVLGFGSATNQTAAQAAIAADPSLIDPTSPNYQGAFIGPAGTAPGILGEGGLLVGDIFGTGGNGIPTWLLVGGIIAAVVIFSPSINAGVKAHYHE